MATKEGYVYIFTNESFRDGWVKIGKTQDIKRRLKDLDNTSCPLPFKVYATMKTCKYNEAEELVQEFIAHFNSDLRIRPNREYFKVSPEEALKIFYQVQKVIDDAEIEVFVKGKAPKEIAKKHIDLAKVFDEAVNIILPDLYRKVLEEEQLEPYAQPQVNITKISDVELGVTFVITTAPEVELGQYKGLKIGKVEPKVEDKEVEEAIEKLRLQNASLIVKEGASELGDTVVMDFVGSIDGEKFEGGSAQNYELELGSHAFIPGFEEQLVGLKAGEHKDVKVTFPKEYTPELAGKDALFACDVHEVKAKKLPELDDEFVKDLKLRGVETVEALKENKKQELLAEKQRNGRNEFFGKLYAEIVKGSKISIPESMIKEQAERSKKEMEQRMAQSGLTLEQYLQFTGQKSEDFEAKLAEDAKRDISNYFVLLEVGKKEEIEVTDADVEFEMAKLAEQYNMKIEDVKKALEAQIRDFRHNLEMTRVEDFLFENND